MNEKFNPEASAFDPAHVAEIIKVREEALARGEDPEKAVREFNEKVIHGDFKAGKVQESDGEGKEKIG
ncbi:hypothetical protein HYW73_00260 [Candidatus Nomurabacteria bacterium]|nr:hypothetical protein [Candidatus Nomurabacteria bacterium]